MTDVASYDVSTYEVLPPELPAAEPARPRLLIIGTALTGVAIVVGFAALIGVYLAQRAQVVATGERWLPEGTEIPLTQPNFMAITLVMSAVAMAWAVYASRNADRGNTLTAVGLTLLFGFAFISQTAFLLAIMALPVLDSGLQGWLIWSIIGIHLALVVAAMGYVAVMGLRTLGGQLSARDQEGVQASAIFWYVAVGVYLVIWYAVYITK